MNTPYEKLEPLPNVEQHLNVGETIEKLNALRLSTEIMKRRFVYGWRGGNFLFNRRTATDSSLKEEKENRSKKSKKGHSTISLCFKLRGSLGAFNVISCD